MVRGEMPSGWPALLLVLAIAACQNASPAGATREPPPPCGNGRIDAGEACDEGPENSDELPGACRTTCRPASCGDGVTDPGEGCDDGASNGVPPSTCRETCVLASCGDGTIDPGEECDAGAENSDTFPDACRTSCTTARCGDGTLDTDERCDDGLDNSDRQPDACRRSCEPSRCGDDVRDTGEACDAGTRNSDTRADACRATCALPRCGDGVVDAGEECDDADADAGDACDDRCAVPADTCGNGVIDPGEDCDDGDTEAGDGCDGRCWVEVPTHCNEGRNHLIDLRTEGTSDGGNGYLYAHTTVNDPNRISGCGCNGPEAVHAYVVRDTGDLLVEVEVPPDGPLEAVPWIASACGRPPTELACPNFWEQPRARRVVVARNVSAETGVLFVMVEGNNYTAGEYRLHVRVVPPIPGGGACRTDLSTGLCSGEDLGHACADPDGDGQGTCVPNVPAGATCDPAGERDVCLAGWCKPVGSGGICSTPCGNGRLDEDEGEECDDGNDRAGDGCSPTCRAAGRSCDDPYPLSVAWTPSTRAATWHAGRLAGSGDPASSCARTRTYRYGVAVFTAPEAGRYAFTALEDEVAPSPSRIALSLRSACGDPLGELACLEHRGPTLTRDLAAGETVHVLIEDLNVALASYTLTAARLECGDGRRVPPEGCDDGNILADDGCSPTCVADGDTCASPFVLSPGATGWSGNLAAFRDSPGPSCAEGGPDAFALFTAPVAGTYAFSATGVGAVALLAPDCGTTRACRARGDGPNPLPVAASLAAGEAVMIQVGKNTLASQDFAVEVTRPSCGDGVTQSPEECDDGNLSAGDGCSPSCAAEALEQEPNDARLQATSATVGRLHRGAIGPGTDVDFWSFAAVAGTPYTVSASAGRSLACQPGDAHTHLDLRVQDGTGRILGDDGDLVDRCLRLTVTPATTGTLFVRVSYWDPFAPIPETIDPYFLSLESP